MAAFLAEAADHLRRGGSVSGLPVGAQAWVLDRALAGPAWIVTATPEEAELLARITRFHARGRGGPPVLHFAADDLPPFSGVSPHPVQVRERWSVLDALRRGTCARVVLSVAALQTRILQPDALATATRVLRPGHRIPRSDLLPSLADLGYLTVPAVEDPGTYAVRGGLVDLWPTGTTDPVRLDFVGDELEAIRAFDPTTRRGRGLLDEVRILPAREWVNRADLPGRFLAATQAHVGSDPASTALRRRVVEVLKAHLSLSGIEDWLPALDDLATPLAYAPQAPVVVVDPDRVRQEAQAFHASALRRFQDLGPDERPLVDPTARFVPPDEVARLLETAPRILPLALGGALDVTGLDNAALRVGTGDLAPLVARLRAWLEQGWRVVLAASGPADAERLQALLEAHHLRPRPQAEPDTDRLRPGSLTLWTGDLPRGFQAPEDQLVVLPTGEIFVERQAAPAGGGAKALRRAATIGFGSLKERDLVVHAAHGIGEYLGMSRIALGEVQTDFLKLGYRGGDILYVPVHKLDLLSRYRSATEGARPILDRLGGQTWKNRKARVRDLMVRTAHELLEIHARREVAERPPMPPPGRIYRRFEANFPFEETTDQAQAVREVMVDLDGTRPMDRVIVGDVGFGKTEVAMRAAARFLEIGRQVAVLCPTTVLAFQHHETWRERFAGTGARIGMLSRLTDAREARTLLREVKEGRIDLLIGTTRILSPHLRFADLGLVVVDEEHRFGVRQKEQLKKLRAEVDILSLSATPIPRTLHLALSGLRAFSAISTPPSDRLAIRTRIARFEADVIREEIVRELQRGGQVFFVHNRVSSIQSMARFVARLVPEARVEVTHGQMEPEVLEEALVRFVRKQADVLVTTSIIESGVDLPNVNCIIIHRADRFGLAQLYQIRGRVGRSFRRGRCILLVPDEGGLSRVAVRRLRVLQEHQELGAGFAVASADLEQRGPGAVLGENQHGHVDAVGLDTYVELLQEALAEARGILHRKALDPDVEVPVPAYVPESYVAGVAERLEEYRLLSLQETPARVRACLDAMEERLGSLPPEVLNLGWLLELRLRCRELGVARLAWLRVRAELRLAEQSLLSPERLAALVKKAPDRLACPEPGVLHARFTPQEAEHPFRFLHWMLRLLEADVERTTGA